MSPVRALLFDLDGTLLDTLADIGNAMNAALRSFGFTGHTLDTYRGFIGRGMEQLVAVALPPDAKHRKDDVVARFRACYRERLVVETRTYPGIVELLDALQQRGLPLAILSNKPDAPTQALVQQLLGRWAFRDVRGERAGVRRKPAPDAALSIAQGLGVSPAECALLGDSAVDIETARGAGMQAWGALWGFRGRPELEAAGAEALLAHPEDVLGLLR